MIRIIRIQSTNLARYIIRLPENLYLQRCGRDTNHIWLMLPDKINGPVSFFFLNIIMLINSESAVIEIQSINKRRALEKISARFELPVLKLHTIINYYLLIILYLFYTIKKNNNNPVH